MSRTPAAAGARALVLWLVAGLLLAVWAFPVLWGLLTSFKTERDVLAYPPTVLFEPTLDNYREVLFGSSTSFATFFVNSLVITLPAVVIPIALALLAAEEAKWSALLGESASGRTNAIRKVRHKTLQVAQSRITTALNRLTPKGESDMSEELSAALDKVGL